MVGLKSLQEPRLANFPNGFLTLEPSRGDRTYKSRCYLQNLIHPFRLHRWDSWHSFHMQFLCLKLLLIRLPRVDSNSEWGLAQRRAQNQNRSPKVDSNLARARICLESTLDGLLCNITRQWTPQDHGKIAGGRWQNLPATLILQFYRLNNLFVIDNKTPLPLMVSQWYSCTPQLCYVRASVFHIN